MAAAVTTATETQTRRSLKGQDVQEGHAASREVLDDEASTTWPYAIGFNVDAEQREPVELEVTGNIPAYAAGTMYRTAPSAYKVKTDQGKEFKLDHWFDGFTTVHRFKLEPRNADPSKMRVWYNSRRAVDELVERIRKNGRLDEFSFANKRDPCESIFRKAMSAFTTQRIGLTGQSSVNIGVTVTVNMANIQKPATASSQSPGVDSLITNSDNSVYERLHPDTLEPYGYCDQTALHPDLKGPMSAAHAKTDPLTGEVFNFNLDFGATCVYRVFQASPSTGQVNILAKFSAPPAYLHSLFLTPSTVILCIWNSRFTKHGISVLLNRNVLDSLVMDKAAPAQWFVIDRTPARRGVIATYTSDPFFCFHTINAYEEASPDKPGQTDIVADLVEYKDLSVINGFYYSQLVPERSFAESYTSKHPNSRPYFARYRLPAVPIDTSKTKASSTSSVASCELKSASGVNFELPTINPYYNIRKHRYIYGIRQFSRSAFNDGLAKYDTQTDESTSWTVHGHTPGEAIFIADPEGEAEDDGVLLTVVLDGWKERSYLLCLDARTMEEVGRAETPIVIGHGLHGVHVPTNRQRLNSGH